MNETKPSENLPFHPKNRKSHNGNKKSAFRAPTAGFDRITFDVEDPSCASKFKDHVDALAGHLGLTLKKGGPALAMAMRNGKKPVFTYPTALDPTEQQDRLKVFGTSVSIQEWMMRREHLQRTITVPTSSSLSTALPLL